MAQRATGERPGGRGTLLHPQFTEDHIEQIQRGVPRVLALQQVQPRRFLAGRAVVGQHLLGHQPGILGRVGHHGFEIQALALGILFQQGHARVQHGRAHLRALARDGRVADRQRMVGGLERDMGRVQVGRLGLQRGLRLFAVVMDDLRHGFVHQPVQGLDGLDGARPIVPDS